MLIDCHLAVLHFDSTYSKSSVMQRQEDPLKLKGKWQTRSIAPQLNIKDCKIILEKVETPLMLRMSICNKEKGGRGIIVPETKTKQAQHKEGLQSEPVEGKQRRPHRVLEKV